MRENIKISNFHFNRFKIIYNILYGNDTISIKNDEVVIKIKENWFLRIVKLFLFIKPIKIKYSLFNLLVRDIPNALSLISANNYDFSILYQDDIDNILSRKINTCEKIEYIIDLLFNKLQELNPRNYYTNLGLIELKNIKNDITINPTMNEVEESYEEKQGLTYILDTFLWNNRKVYIKKIIVNYFISIWLDIFPIKETYIINKNDLFNFYISKSPPLSGYYYNL